MFRLRRCILIFVTLLTGVGAVRAASSAEDRAYSAAANAFQTGFWNYADAGFGEFIQKYPESSRVPAAILFQAEARFNLKRYADAFALLSAHRGKAGMWEDEYLYWMAQARLRETNDQAAAELFGRLVHAFPDSPRRLEALVGEGTAWARLRQWPRVTELLGNPAGAFQREAASVSTNRFVPLGWLLLGEAQLAQGKLPAAGATLAALGKLTLSPRLNWRREYLQCRLLLAKGELEAALQNTTNLLSIATAASPAPLPTNAVASTAERMEAYVEVPAARLLSESWTLRASILERLVEGVSANSHEITNLLADAIAAYRNNLQTNAPADQQRLALLKTAELSLAQHDPAAVVTAVNTLESYWQEFPRSSAADMALLALGELQLKRHSTATETNNAAAPTAAGTPGTNRLTQALGWFDTLLTNFPNSKLAGKALLDKGWCFWGETNYQQSRTAFRLATERLPFSEDQAVARFKLADSEFMLKQYPAAITNYELLVTKYASAPEIKRKLFEQALYQTVRAALAVNDLPAATNALESILEWFPDGFAGPRCLLLVGQGFNQEKDPTAARKLFAEFQERYPTNALLPEVQMAEARTYEQQGEWEGAIRQYSAWIDRFTNHIKLPEAEFRRAWDYSMAGHETNALDLFTNFVARFPTNELAQQAQWWMGDYYFQHGDYASAEYNYQLVFKSTNWSPSELTYHAQMMAGRSAVARLRYKDAITYFTGLAGNSNCPPELALRALFAYGDAEMNLDSGETNQAANLDTAITIFGKIPPTNRLATLALGRIGDCYLQLAANDATMYTDASNYYAQVIRAPQATVTARSQAEVGQGIVAERLAGLQKGAAQEALLQQALDDYLDVFFQRNLRDGEQADAFWVRKAGLEAARVAENLQQWSAAVKIYRELENWLPGMRATLDSRITRAERNAGVQDQ